MTYRAAVLTLLIVLAPAAHAQDPSAAETVVDIRVHGNHTTPDAEIIRIAGLSTGTAFSPSLIPDVEGRLRQSGRFRSIEVRKRYQSIEDASAVLLIIVVEEQAGVSEGTPKPGVLRRMKAGTMWLPVLTAEDGYGLTYGARVSLVDALGRQTRLSVPLTWGGERRASVEVERRFTHGPLTRIAAEAGITRREHPGLDLSDRRTGAGVRAERALSSWFRLGGQARVSDVRFGDSDDRLRTLGMEATLDTRHDPAFARNAVYASATVERLWFEQADATGRVLTDVRGYVGLVRQVVFVARLQQAWAADALPPFEQSLLGGTASLRGFPLGYRMGDRLAAASAEVRMPINSPLRLARTGVALFADAGTVYGADERLADARWDRSLGAGVFIIAPVISFRLDVAHGLDGGTRAHFTLRFGF
jgi:outer membrane protein assembly factor BamA